MNSTLRTTEICTAPVISFSGVSKCHLIYERPEDRLKQIIVPRLQRSLGLAQSRFYKEFWALRDISFAVGKGETIGIIGRNGAGKSTLLQILCGTLNPTSGSIDTEGRIAALLELGAGFNPEFSGRENVHLNAAVLGLSMHEIEERFEAIANFADIGEFIDRPVKTYSSGMFVRLAFAVIAHVDADILVIDEALAVGDTVFNQKCMRFLRRFKTDKNLIFVSHDINSVINLCDKAIWLDRGEIKMFGGAKEVAEAYVQEALTESKEQNPNSPDRPKTVDSRMTVQTPSSESKNVPSAQRSCNEEHHKVTLLDNLGESAEFGQGNARITSVRMTHRDARHEGVFRAGDPIILTIEAAVSQDFESPIIGFAVKDRLGQWLFGENTYECGCDVVKAQMGHTLTSQFTFCLPRLPSGQYSLMVAVAEGTPLQNTQHHWIHDAIVFNVIGTKPGLGLMGIPFDSISLSHSTAK
jgi:lipopolysaccharide transport system ATP-binding protein